MYSVVPRASKWKSWPGDVTTRPTIVPSGSRNDAKAEHDAAKTSRRIAAVSKGRFGTVFSGRRIIFWLLLAVTLAASLSAQPPVPLAARIQTVMSRPVFAHANFGVEFFDLQTGEVIYALNPDKMFAPASTTKLLSEGTVLAKLGGDFRFHTFVYRTGPIDKHGRLKGDVVV